MFKANNPTTCDEAAFDNRVFDCFEFDHNPGRITRPLPVKPYQKNPRKR
jgi:hypothetical protein